MKLRDFQVLQSRILQVLSGTSLGERSRGSKRKGLNMLQVMSTGGGAVGGMFADLGSKSHLLKRQRLTMPSGVPLLFTIAHSLYLHATLVDEITGKSGRQLCKIPETSGPSKKFDRSLIGSPKFSGTSKMYSLAFTCRDVSLFKLSNVDKPGLSSGNKSFTRMAAYVNRSSRMDFNQILLQRDS